MDTTTTCTNCNDTGRITVRSSNCAYVCAGEPPEDAQGYVSATCFECAVRVLIRKDAIMNASESMRLVILESPFAAPAAADPAARPSIVRANIAYARACVRDSLLRGEAPIASHLLYTQDGILDDDIPAERQHGIDAGLAWRAVAHASVVYTDRGISRGMEYGIAAAMKAGRQVEFRSLVERAVA